MSVKILILEDDPERIDWFKRAFTNPDIVSHVKDAYNKLSNNQYDIVFLDRDLGNPHETGEDLAWQMKQEKLAPDSHIIIHSANDRGQRVMAKYISSYNKNIIGIKFHQLSRLDTNDIYKLIGFAKTSEVQPEAIVEKNSQASTSVTDFLLNYFPQRSKEYEMKEAADFLFAIWKDGKNKIAERLYRKPSDIPSSELEDMQNQGLVRCIGDRIEITAKGSEAIKTIILGDNNSALSKEASQITYHQAKANIEKSKSMKKMSQSRENSWWNRATKIASKNEE